LFARERDLRRNVEDSMNPNGFRRTGTAVAAKTRLTILSFLVFLLAFSAAAQALAQELDTIEPGKLIVGFNGDMPMTSLQDGQLIGSDGKMIAKIAADLGL
jgi:ABC-type amino acid transport substrate-binding protein